MGIDKILDQTWSKIFDFDFPCWVEDGGKEHLCKQILEHYYMREIGSETYGLWHLNLRNKMQRIMPYYTKLWESEKLIGNPFVNIDEWRTIDKDGTNAHTDIGQQSEATHNNQKQDTTQTGTENRIQDQSTTRNGTEKLTQDQSTSHSGTDNLTKEQSTEDAGTSKTVTDQTAHTSMTHSGEMTESGTQSGSGEAHETDSKTTLFSDTPQNGLTAVLNGTYLTTAQKEDGSSDTTNSNSGESSKNGSNSENGTQDNTGKTTVDGTTSDTGSLSETDNRTTSDSGTLEDTKNRTTSDVGHLADQQDSKSTQTGNLTGEQNGKREVADKRTHEGSYTDDIDEHHTGWVGDKIDSLTRYRETFLQIPQMIIDELAPLFIGILE